MKKKPRRPSPTAKLLNAVSRLLRNLEHAHTTVTISEHPPRFITCWAVHGRPVTQALDASGQVWELHTVMDGATKTVSEQFWTRIGMERR